MGYTYPFEQFKELWESEPLVVFDTNGLLSLYRFSPGTTNNILNVLHSMSSQLWIPAQVLEEFNKNHKDVVRKEHNKYKAVKKEVERIIEIAKNDFSKQFIRFTKFRFPRVNELGNSINSILENIFSETYKFEEEIEEEVKKNIKMLEEDKVKLFIDHLIEHGSVGTPYAISTMIQIFAEGELRYKYQIPPGYKDISKDNNDVTKRQKFGDLLLWKQVLEKAQSSQKAVIFITMDEKEDWWVLDNKNDPLRPRDELLNEFHEYSDHPLAMMSLTNFINHISVLKTMFDNRTYLEMNANEVCQELIEQVGWDVTLGDSKLLSYLIHSGDLQDLLENALADVKIEDYSQPNLSINTVDIDGNRVNIEGSFECEMEAAITETYSGNYSETNNALVTISGSINMEFEADFEKEDDFIKRDTCKVNVGGFEVLNAGYDYVYYDELESENEGCINCGDSDPSYFTKDNKPVCEVCSAKYETCPDCGKLFENGTLGGAFCVDCEMKR